MIATIKFELTKGDGLIRVIGDEVTNGMPTRRFKTQIDFYNRDLLTIEVNEVDAKLLAEILIETASQLEERLSGSKHISSAVFDSKGKIVTTEGE